MYVRTYIFCMVLQNKDFEWCERMNAEAAIHTYMHPPQPGNWFQWKPTKYTKYTKYTYYTHQIHEGDGGTANGGC